MSGIQYLSCFPNGKLKKYKNYKLQSSLLYLACILRRKSLITFQFFRMASEASKRAEEDRMRRIQLQEEQDLAYAIALSKAEAVSVKQQ